MGCEGMITAREKRVFHKCIVWVMMRNVKKEMMRLAAVIQWVLCDEMRIKWEREQMWESVVLFGREYVGRVVRSFVV